MSTGSNEQMITGGELVAKALKAEGIDHTNRFYFLGYNAPYEVFNRKNEIIVEVQAENQ